MFYMYIIQSTKDDFIYLGSTKDLKQRFVEHNSRKVESSKSHLPYRLLYYEAYLSEKDARIRESMLKLRGQARVQLMNRLKHSFEQGKT